MGERFASFEANKSYLLGAIAQIDAGDLEGAFATLTRCHGDIDENGLVTPLDPSHPDYEKYQTLDGFVLRALKVVASDPAAARRELIGVLRTFGWEEEAPAAAKKLPSVE